MEAVEKVQLTVSGRVQGVAFRYMTKIVADRLNIKGIVRNLDDGDVYIEAQGPKEQLDVFIKAVKASPTPSGRVDQVEIVYNDQLPDYKNFKVVS